MTNNNGAYDDHDGTGLAEPEIIIIKTEFTLNLQIKRGVLIEFKVQTFKCQQL